MEDAIHIVDNLLDVFLFPTSIELHVSDIKQYKKDTQQLKQAMKQYYHTAQLNIDMTIGNVLNNYISLMMQTRDNDDIFENIWKYFNCVCNVNQCNAIRRRNAKNATQKMDDDIIDKIVQQIMDKIHCYFFHSYDIGYRLNRKEKAIVNKMAAEKKENNPLSDTKFNCINSILQQRRQQISENRLINHHMRFKYNQLISEETKEEIKTYSFGTKFKYIFTESEMQLMEAGGCGYNTGQFVPMKFASLKEEVTQNTLCVINVDTYNSEYMKAQRHFDTFFCRSKYRPFVLSNLNVRIEVGHIKVDHLLAMMFYSNMDRLQYEFSKTYRDNIEQHQQFHHLGKYLKILVNVFGEMMSYSNVKTLYHGLSESLSFTKYGIGIDTIIAQGPLSTTSSIEVAGNFAAASDEGLIITFDANLSTIFDASWLSDFPAEREYLLIQMDPKLRGLSIKDIMDTHSNIKYGILFNTLESISNLLKFLSVNVDYSPLITLIIEHQLSVHFSEHEPFLSLTQYGKQICNSYFAKQRKIIIDLNRVMKNHEELSKILFDLKGRAIHLNKMNILYPNVGTIKCQNISTEASIVRYKPYFKQKNLLIYNESDTIYIVRMNEMKKHFDERAIDSLLCFGKKEHSFPSDSSVFSELDNAIKALVSSQNGPKVRELDELCKFVLTPSGQKKKDLVWDWSAIISKKKSCLFDLFCCAACSWIDVPAIINQLWPDLRTIEMVEIYLSNDVIKTILMQLNEIRNTCNLKRITIYPLEGSELNIDEAIAKYQNKFRCINCSVFKSFGSFTILLKLADSFYPWGESYD